MKRRKQLTVRQQAQRLVVVAQRHGGIVPVVQAGDPVLRQVAEPWDGQLEADLLAELVEVMRTTMHDAPGVGLAAPQIGLPLAMAVMEDEGEPDAEDPRERYALPFRVVLNPVYEALGEETATYFEGCLSVEGYQAVVTRPHRVRLTATDERGRPVDEDFSGWPARIVQHETDHLNGQLYVDRADLRTLSSNHNLELSDEE